MRGRIYFSVILFCIFSLQQLYADSVLTKLERGDVISARMGNAIVLQGIFRTEFDEIEKLFSSDLSPLAKRMPEIAYIKPFRSSDGRPLLYIKVRGLLDGTSFLVEIKEAKGEASSAFGSLIKNSKLLPLDSRDFSLQDSVVPFTNPWLSTFRSEISSANSKASISRSLGGYGKEMVFTLDGPLNPSLSMAGVRFQLKCELQAYEISNLQRGNGDRFSDFFPKLDGSVEALKWTHFNIQLSVLPTTAKEELGDFRGFGERRLAAAEWGGLNFVRDLRSVLENL